ncbi:MAG: RimK family alpha-L-glutamate ligase [Planctomycetes bacterium]|nr:RimK family alpha-L-glutamate ligase [Planctomycetota bacterium]
MKIVILSRRTSLYSTRRLRQAARLHGFSTSVVDPLHCLMLLHPDANRIQVGGKELRRVDAVIPRIGSVGIDYGIAVVQQWESMGIPVLNPAAGILNAKDKLRSLQCFSRHRIPIPPTVVTRYPRSVERAVRELGGPPVVIKLLRGTQGMGVIIAESDQGIRSVLDTLWSLGQDILIQKYIAESRGVDVRVLVLNGEPIAAMRRHARSGEFRSNVHLGGVGEGLDLPKPYARIAVQAAKAVGLRLAGVDLLESKSGPLVIEVNASPGFQGLEEATQMDIAGRIVTCAARLASERTCASSPSRSPA